MAKTARSPARSPRARAVVVSGIDDARLACRAAKEAGAALEIWSLRSGAASMGPLWFQEMMRLVESEFPGLDVRGILDCGDAPGHALAALRQGLPLIAFSGPAAVRRKIVAIAKQTNAALVARPRRALDIAAETDAEAALHAWFARTGR